MVVVAHPRPRSFVHALAEAAAGALSEDGHDVAFHDLYLEGFNPVLDPAEALTTRESDDTAFTVGADPLTSQHRRELATADALVAQLVGKAARDHGRLDGPGDCRRRGLSTPLRRR